MADSTLSEAKPTKDLAMAGKAAAMRPEVGLVLYPGCQLAMVHGMTDLIDIAGQFARIHGESRSG
ncbi:hypothetical protein ACFSTI_00725 [Rhizorhabdus histidinilytica]